MSGEKEVCNNITQGSQSINLIGDYVMQFFPPGRMMYLCSNVESYICEAKRKKGGIEFEKDDL